MRFLAALVAAIALVNGSALAAETCDVPQSLIASGDNDLPRVTKAVKDEHRLNISVVGTGSSTLPGPDGARYAYPARLEAFLEQQLPGTAIKVTAHVKTRQTTAEMTADLKKILDDDKPALVVWQAGTFDAVIDVEPEEFSASLDAGIQIINAGGADVDLVNMQYSPRTESMLNVSAYDDVMHWASQQHGTPLFNRLEIMRYWNDQGTFDLYAPTKKYDMARTVHDCIGRALASQIINAAHLDAGGSK